VEGIDSFISPEPSHCGCTSTWPGSELEDLRVIRNFGEHKDERLLQSKGKWPENMADNQKWLKAYYGENSVSAYFLSAGANEVKVGDQLSLKVLKA
jgi:hypothetical protein